MKKIIFIFFLSFRLLMFSQADSLSSRSDYIETMRNKLNLRVEFDKDLETYDYNETNSNYSIKPNTGLRMSVAVSYKFLDLKLGFSPKFLTGDTDLKGNTDALKIDMDFFFLKKWIQTFEISIIKGYYLENISDPGSFNLPNNPDYIILPHLKTRLYRGVTSYVFNNNFSLKSLLNQIEIQRRSAGSLVPSLTYEYFKITDNSTFRNRRSLNFILNTGYYYTFVFNRNWHVNLGVSPGLGYGFNKIRTEDDIEIDWGGGIIYNVNSLIGLDYNSDSFFGGITYSGTYTGFDDNEIIIDKVFRSFFKVSVGYRLKAPKFANKSFNRVEEKFPILKDGYGPKK